MDKTILAKILTEYALGGGVSYSLEQAIEDIEKAATKEAEKLTEYLENKIKVHKHIIESHTVAPFDWHEGNIKAFTEVLEFLQALQK